MLAFIKQWVEPPIFDGDHEKTSQAKIANTIIVYLGTALLFTIFILIPLFAIQKIGSWIIAGVVLCALALGRYLIFKKRLRAGFGLIFSVVYLCILVMLLLSGGSSSTAMFYFAAVVLIAGFFLEARVVNGFTIPTFLIAMGCAVLQENGLLVLPQIFVFNSFFSWFATGLGLLIMIRARDLFVGDLKSAIANTQLKNQALQTIEATLRENEEKFRRMVETANEGVIALDRDARITLVNQLAASRLGYTIEELLGQKFDDFLFEDELEDHRAQMHRRENKESSVYERCLRRRDGSKLWTIISATAVTDTAGRFNGSFGMITDITERKQAEKALRLSEEKFAKIFRMNPSAIILARVNNARIVEINDAFTAVFGYSRQEIAGCSTIDLGLWVNPDDRQMLLNRLANGSDMNNIELLVYTKDKQIVTCSASFETVDIEGELHILGVLEDISERKRADRALVEAQALTKAIVESTSDMIWTVDPENFGLLTFNHGLSDYFLEGRGMHIQAGMRPEDLFPPGEIVQRWHEFYQRALNEGSYTVEYGTFTGLITLQLTFNLLLRDGKLFGISVFGRDITERKRAEEQLRESEQRFRTIIENAPIAISIGRNGKFLYVNPSYVRWHGFTSADELIGRPTVERVAPQHVEATLERARQRAKGLFLEEAPYELTGLRRDGTEISLLVAVSQVKLADGPANIGFFQDITARKKAEEALRESEARFRDVLENSLDASYKRNLQTDTYDYLSPTFLKISGYTADEFIHLPAETVLELTHPADRAEGKRVMTESLTGAAGSSYYWDYRFMHKDGRYRWLHDQFILMRDAQGQPAAWIGSVSDITERKQRENELEVIAALSTDLRTVSNRAEMLPVIVQQLVPLLHCDAASAEMIDPATDDTIVEAAHGTWAALIGYRQPAHSGLNPLIRETRRPYHNNRFEDISRSAISEFSGTGIHAVAGVPLIAQDQLIGILWMGRKTEISEYEVRLLAAVADMTANALHRAALHERTKKYAMDLTLAYDTTLEGWAHALELRDQETEGHSRHVVQLTVDLARAMGAAEDEMEHIRRGALLHDVGKMGIPDSVLLKPGTLNDREWEIMRRHPEYAYQLLQPIEYLRPVIDIPYCHHEKWDGSGYPRGLKGEEIPLAARIFAIVDVWDALLTDRPYRKAWTVDKARSYLTEQSGLHFDPKVVQSFLEMIAKK